MKMPDGKPVKPVYQSAERTEVHRAIPSPGSLVPAFCTDPDVSERVEKTVFMKSGTPGSGMPEGCDARLDSKGIDLKKDFDMSVQKPFQIDAGKTSYVFKDPTGGRSECVVNAKTIDKVNNRSFDKVDGHDGPTSRPIHVVEMIQTNDPNTWVFHHYKTAEARAKAEKIIKAKGCDSSFGDSKNGNFDLYETCHPFKNLEIVVSSDDKTIKNIKCTGVSTFGDVMALLRQNDGIWGMACYKKQTVCYKTYHPTIQANIQNKNTTEDNNAMVNANQNKSPGPDDYDTASAYKKPDTTPGPDDVSPGPDDYDGTKKADSAI